MNRIGIMAAGVAGALMMAFAGSASAATYHSPGYKGDTSFANVTAAPLPAISLGTGKDPDLLVDASGTAHVVFAQDGGNTAPDTLAFCNLQRGLKSCASQGVAPNPQAPDSSQGGAFAGNFPGGNHDFDGPVPLAVGNQLFIIDRRFPDVFTVPGGRTSASNVFEWSSVDGGATITGPGQLGDNQMAGGAVAFGDPAAPSIGTLSRTQTEGTFFQATAAGEYTQAKAQLGAIAQAYDGSLAVDDSQPITRPVAAFDDTSGGVFVREYSGSGDPNDAANWSQTSFSGYSPQIVGGPAGVFVLSSDSGISGGNLTLRRIVNGAPSGGAVSLGTSLSSPAISEDATGNIAFAYTDANGIEVRSSSNGSNFTDAALAAAAAPGSIAHLVTASTSDGGGFVSYVANPQGAEGVGQVLVSAFGTQLATGKPGLGPLPGGGIGSAAGDAFATSTCNTAGFGDVQAVNATLSCWAHTASNPNLDVSLGEVDINGIRLLPDAGVRIGIDPKLHTIDTTGSVRLELSGPGVDVTLFHGEIHAKIPNPIDGADLFDIVKPGTLVEGFPISGDIDFKLTKGGVQIPISLSMPGYFGGVTGSATLQASFPDKFNLSSLEFTIGDANFAALELRGISVTYTSATDTWAGRGELEIPAGGSALDSKVSVTFKNGDFAGGSLDASLPYPGIPLDDTDPPPQLYLSHGGLGFQLHPATLTGTVGFGVTPLLPPGQGGRRDYAFSLDGRLDASFGNPVTISLGATGFLYTMQIADGKLVYRIPNQVTLNGTSSFNLGILKFEGKIGAVIDPKDNLYGAQIRTRGTFKAPDPFPDVSLPTFSVAINNKGFAVFLPLPGVTVPFPPFTLAGTIAYNWGDTLPTFYPYQDMTGRFTTVIPNSAASAAAVGASFRVPLGAPTASIVVRGRGGAPAVSLIAPGGRRIKPNGKRVAGMRIGAFGDPDAKLTTVGIQNPKPGIWRVAPASGNTVAFGAVRYSIGVAHPKVRAILTGRGRRKTVRYQVSALPDGVTVRFAERTQRMLRAVGRARRRSGVLHFTPADGPAGRRQLVAQVLNNGLIKDTVVLGTFKATKPPKPGKAAKLKVRSTAKSFTFTYRPPANADHVVVTIIATDGRHLQRVVKATTKRGTIPVIGFTDGVTVTVIGVAADGRRGASVTAKAKRKT